MEKLTMNRTKLLALAERVEAGETGEKLRIAIAVSLGWGRGTHGYTRRPAQRNWTHPSTLPAWEHSIDAQAALPGRITDAVEDGDGEWDASAWPPGGNRHYDAHAPTEPAARLAALLRAMAEDAA